MINDELQIPNEYSNLKSRIWQRMFKFRLSFSAWYLALFSSAHEVSFTQR